MSREKFFTPKVSAGTVVKWSPGNGSGWFPAIVSKVSLNTITVAVLRPSATTFIAYDSVRHIDDPGFKKLADPAKTGVWDYSDETKLLARVATRVLGPAVVFEVCPAFADRIAAYTPTESNSSYSDDDPDVHGA